MHNSATWTTRDGVRYNFAILSYEATWNHVGGIYMFARQEPNGSWTALYIGKCESFRDRVCGHERWEEARRLGATAVLALVVHNDGARSHLEEMLIREIQPTLNTHYRGPTLGAFRNLRGF